MGITIHYRGNLQDKNQINSFIEELTDIAKTMNWQTQVLDEDWTQPSTAKLSSTKNGVEITGYLALKGILIRLHPDCEPLSLFFDAKGCLISPFDCALGNDEKTQENSYVFVKTQFAPPDVHITIIKLLKYLKKRYIPDLEVIDEGGYWETEDKLELIKKLDFINDKIQELGNIIADIKITGNQNYSAEQLAAILEEKLKKL